MRFPEELAEELGCSLRQARQLMVWHWGGPRPELRRGLLQAAPPPSLPEVIERVEDTDGGLRFLFRLADGVRVEAVRIPLEKRGRFTVCLSSQVGCAMRCGFCATGKLGLSRNLSAQEMCGCLLAVRASLGPEQRLTGVVFMGQGEPFHNYDAVIRAARLLCHPNGGRITAKSISISTVGLVPQIHRFAQEGHKFRLVVSMTSSVQERRERVLPVAGKWTLEELAEAIRAVHLSQGRRMTVAWVLLGGVNHDAAEVEGLRRLLADVPIRLNLIDVNGDLGYRRASEQERGDFLDALQVLQVPVVRRYSVGSESNSACGMLAARS